MLSHYKIRLSLLAAAVTLLGMSPDGYSDTPEGAKAQCRQAMHWNRSPVQTKPNGLPILHSNPGAPVSIFIDFQFEAHTART